MTSSSPSANTRAPTVSNKSRDQEHLYEAITHISPLHRHHRHDRGRIPPLRTGVATPGGDDLGEAVRVHAESNHPQARRAGHAARFSRGPRPRLLSEGF